MPVAVCAAAKSQVITSAITFRLPFAVKALQRGGKTCCLVVTGSSRSDLWLPYGKIVWLLWLPPFSLEPCPYSAMRCGATASRHRVPASLAGNKRCHSRPRHKDPAERSMSREHEGRPCEVRTRSCDPSQCTAIVQDASLLVDPWEIQSLRFASRSRHRKASRVHDAGPPAE